MAGASAKTAKKPVKKKPALKAKKPARQAAAAKKKVRRR
jgi:hypothetical protein